MRQFGELEAVIMNRLWARNRSALVREAADDLQRPAYCVHDGDGRDGQLVPQAVAAPAPGRPGPMGPNGRRGSES